jgi:hypothetical protein
MKIKDIKPAAYEIWSIKTDEIYFVKDLEEVKNDKTRGINAISNLYTAEQLQEYAKANVTVAFQLINSILSSNEELADFEQTGVLIELFGEYE